MTATNDRRMLVTQFVPKDKNWEDGSNSPTHRMRIRLGRNWAMYELARYNSNDFEAERTDATPRLVELSGNTPVAVTIGNCIYPVTLAS